MQDKMEFEKVVAEKVTTLKENIRLELEKDPEAKKLKIPFYVPIRFDRLFDDFKKTVAQRMLSEGYEMSDFLEEIQVLGYGVIRYVHITKV